jgi:hypothetical protein
VAHVASLHPDLFYLELAGKLLADEYGPPPQPSALEWSEHHATIVSPTEGRMPFRAYPYQAKLLADTSPRRIVLKARQTGLSNAVALEALHLASTRPDSTILFVSRNQDAARQLITYCYHAMTGGAPTPPMVTENQAAIGFANGSTIEAISATPSAGRSKAATRVYLDEFAFSPYDELIYQAVIGTISTGGTLTILSTPNGRANMFFRLWQGLEGGEWSRHLIHWRDCPRYDDEWAQRTRDGMTRQSFAQEYDCDFIASGDNAFDLEDLLKCREGYLAGREGCERYVTGWDIGRRQDHTVGITLGLRGEVWHVAEIERVLEPYPAAQARIDRRVLAYPGAHAVESNGVGDPVIENLTQHVEPYTTTAKTKLQAIQALQLLIQQGRFKYDPKASEAMAQLDRELGLYQYADEALVQDCVMAAAIAAITTKPQKQAGAF